ncbi:bZIP transcription factor 44 [Linum perenne]
MKLAWQYSDASIVLYRDRTHLVPFQVTQLRKANNQILTAINVTTHHFLNDEVENSVLQAQLRELTHRLDSLSEILYFIGINGGGRGRDDNGLCWEMDQVDCIQMTESLLNNPLNSIALSSFS